MSQSQEEKLQKAKDYLARKGIKQKVQFGLMAPQMNIPYGAMAALQERLLTASSPRAIGNQSKGMA